MKIRVFLAAAATLLLAACAGDSSTAPRQLAPNAASRDDLTCRSGYHVATRSDGTQECVPDDESLLGLSGRRR
jgi:hypothetical protein